MSGERVVIAGGSGFIGRALAAALASEGRDVVVLSRSAGAPTPRGVRSALWDGRTEGECAVELDGAGAVINLAGSPVVLRHTARVRDEIIRSRVEPTRALGAAIASCGSPPSVWVQASAIGYYGDAGEDELDESSAPGSTFLARVCREWEHAFETSSPPQVKRVTARIGVVLGRGGGAFPPLFRLARLGLGGATGPGRQYVSWIHLADVVGAIRQMLLPDAPAGVYNLAAPQPLTNAAFMRSVRSAARRPWSPPAPAAALRAVSLVSGIEASLMLESQRVLPRRLLDTGYVFRFPELRDALNDLVESS